MNEYYVNVWRRMREFMKEHKAKQARYTVDEWSDLIEEPTLTSAKMGYMYKCGLVNKYINKKYYGDSLNRYEPVKEI